MIISKQAYIQLKTKLSELETNKYKLENKDKVEDMFSDEELQILKSYKESKSESTENLIQDLLNYLNTFTAITLNIAFKPNQEMKNRLCAYLQNLTDKNMIVDFQYDSTLLAGTVIEVNGVYKDYSYGVGDSSK